MNSNLSVIQRVRLLLIICASALMIGVAQAKDVEFVDLQGQSVNLSDFKGQWVVVNLWATWCPPCVVEMPELVFFHEKYKDKGAMVLGVNYEDVAVEKINSFTDELMISFPIVRFKDIDLNTNRTPFGPLRGLPSTYMVAPSGEIVAARTGMVDLKALETFIQQYEAKNN